MMVFSLDPSRSHSYNDIIFRIDKSMEGLKKKLETAYKASGGRKVNIISHSMGGLLVMCFMSLYPEVSLFFLIDEIVHL